MCVGGGFAAFGQGKAAVAQFGQNMVAPGVTNNPFLVCTAFNHCLCLLYLLFFLLSRQPAVLGYCVVVVYA